MSALDKMWSLKKIDPYAKWRLASFALFGILISSMVVSFYFIYSKIYRTLDDAHNIVILNSSISINNVNLDSYKQAVQALEMKEKPSSIPKDIRDIFVYGPETTSTLPVPTKK